MLIQHRLPSDTLTCDAGTFHADEHGVFDVPEPVGRELLRHAGWSLAVVEEATAEQDELTAAHARIAELEQFLAAAEAALAAQNTQRAQRAQCPKR